MYAELIPCLCSP